jgi:deazaflavin-dependent oxidoreductase (nitroreductase family)
MVAYNQDKGVIEEFRQNGGKVGGYLLNAPIVLITTKGAKTGTIRTTPLMYLPDGKRVVIFASRGGSANNPGWYHNLVANPEITVEVGAEKYQAVAQVIAGEERDRLYLRQSELYPQFATYQRKTKRKIPVIVLEKKE